MGYDVLQYLKLTSNSLPGPLDLEDENPPPSAIAGRQDTVRVLVILLS